MQIEKNISLQPYNTFRMDVNAKLFATFHTIEDLNRILQEYSKEKILILGGGSNLLFTKDYDGLVLKNNLLGIEKIKEDDQHIWIKAMAGENWHQFVLFTLENEWYGLENLSYIPGNVGASPMQNIGAYGVEIKDFFDSLEAYKIENGNIETFDNASCEFGYRESVFKRKFKDQYVICSVTFKLNKKAQIKSEYGVINDELKSMGIDTPSPKDLSNAVINIRKSKLPDPKEIGNSGSFFKNPIVPIASFKNIQKDYPNVPSYPIDDAYVKLPAGWLIETAGWKGKTIDERYGVHKKQALVLVNYENTQGKEIYDLSADIIADIQKKFGVELEREVNIL